MQLRFEVTGATTRDSNDTSNNDYSSMEAGKSYATAKQTQRTSPRGNRGLCDAPLAVERVRARSHAPPRLSIDRHNHATCFSPRERDKVPNASRRRQRTRVVSRTWPCETKPRRDNEAPNNTTQQERTDAAFEQHLRCNARAYFATHRRLQRPKTACRCTHRRLRRNRSDCPLRA